MKAYGLTDVGLKRSMNQDAFFIDNERQLYIVADGMGGHKAGDLASRTAIDGIREFYTQAETLSDEEVQDDETIANEQALSEDAIKYANQLIYEKSLSNPEFHGMGTTIVLLRIIRGHAVTAHVGDSRIYRIQDELIYQLTKDHSRIQELIDQERISAEEAERYPLKNVITRALGGSPEVKVDTSVVPLGKNDVFVLCTDGLSGVLSNVEIAELISANPGDPEESCRRLIQSTLDRGAPDNVTVIVGDTRAYDGDVRKPFPDGPAPDQDEDRGAFRKFIDRWFKGS